MTLVARVTFLVLVGASFSAFFVAQRLKSTPPVIEVREITRYFSPNGDGKRDINDISIRLRVADDATVDVVNLDGDRVKRLAENVADARPTGRCALVWDGTRRRRPARAGRPVPAAGLAARRGPLGDGPEDDDGRHQGAALQVCVGFKCSNRRSGWAT